MYSPTATFDRAASGLPDPQRDRQYYDGVPTRRLLAFFIDLVLVALITGVTVFVLSILTLGFALWFGFLIWAAVDFLYRVLSLSARSATPGMRFMGVEFRAIDGGRIGGMTAIVHTILYYICFGVALVQLVNLVLMLATSQGRSLPDLASGTALINRPA